MTKLVKIFKDGLISNFTETWGTKNTFNRYFNINYVFFGYICWNVTK